MKLRRRLRMVTKIAVAMLLAGGVVLGGPLPSSGANGSLKWGGQSFCDRFEYLCTENIYPRPNGKYIGHDEPAVLFYSDTPGAGNSAIYNVTLPKDPPTKPKQDGTGGTFNFQLHPAFWFGIAMCDTQSFPEFSGACAADSDANIFDGSNPNAADYIGKHPGTAYMEMQFYPPGWVPLAQGGTSCDGTHWCAALNIDSFSFDANNKLNNNSACVNLVGVEPVNFAFITKSGVADTSADPLNPVLVLPNLSKDFLMNPGDNLAVDLHDTTDGFEVVIYDNTTHKQGSMKASIANGFAQVNFLPGASTCTSTPYAFHPMYATSGIHTRVPWAAHSYNVAFADEIGHWDYCDAVDSGGNCVQAGKNETDDVSCFEPRSSSRIKVGGCTLDDLDFDGVCYQNAWPGTNSATDKKLHPQPITFTSPIFNPASAGPLTNYTTATFEADMPAFEPSTLCDVATGAGCTNPPAGAQFYPFFSIGNDKKGTCSWRLGGSSIAGTTNDFSGVAQYGSILPLVFPDQGGPVTEFIDFRQILASNPCNAPSASLTIPTHPLSFGTLPRQRTSALKRLEIANPTPYPITLTALSLPNSDYKIVSDSCTASVLAPAAKCQFGLTLTPSSSGSKNGTATIVSNADNPAPTVELVGAGK